MRIIPQFFKLPKRISSHRGRRLSRIRPRIAKRQKFISGVVVLSVGFFFAEHLFGRSGVIFSLVLSVVTELFLLWAMFEDIRDTKAYQIFILPFFYSLAFGLFYFLTPPRFITSIIVTTLYAIGMYSLFLSQNIFVVASIRTIALLTGARIVSFILTLVSFFFLANVIFSLHLHAIPTSLLLFVFTFLLMYHSLWTYTLEKSLKAYMLWAGLLTLSIFEMSLLLWFWPSTPTVIALFLTGLFYLLAGLSHVWFDKRLFRNVLWEYMWVGLLIFVIFIFSTSWRGSP